MSGEMMNETKAVMARRHRKETQALAEEYFRAMGARCDRGGCDSHSGHEFCSMDAAWDHAVSRAEDELYDRHAAEREASSGAA